MADVRSHRAALPALGLRPVHDGYAQPVLGWGLVGGVVALVLAAATSASVNDGLAVAVLIAAGIAMVRRPANLLLILAASIYFEIFAVQGTTISRLLAPLAFVTVLVQVLRMRGSIRLDIQLVCVVAYAVWGLASGLWSISAAGTAHELSSLGIALAYMAAFAVLLNSDRDLDRLLVAWAITSVITAVISFPSVSSTLGFGNVLQNGRSQGITGDPNEFGAIQLVALPVMIVIAVEARHRWARLALGGAALLNASSIITALSRGALIAFTMLLVVLVVAPSPFVFGSHRSKAIALVVLALAVGGVGVRHSSTLTSRVETLWGQGPTGAQEGSGRVFIWKAAWSSILARPWLGIGYGTYPSVSNSLLLKVPNIDLRIYGPHPGGEPVHNAYLESFVELGILGPILYVGLLVSTAAALTRTARRALRANRPHIARIANSLILSLCTWAITSIFLSSETSRGLWIVIGLSLALPKLLPADGASTSRGLALREAVGAA